MEFNLYKTEVMAEKTVRRLPKHRSSVERGLQSIQNELDGWGDQPDELLQILERAGAVCTFCSNGERKEEW